MKLTTSLLTTTTIVVIIVLHGTDATVETTCKAAADSDKRVNYTFCIDELSNHHESPEADIWGLAKVAALVGADSAGDAMAYIKVLLNKVGIDSNEKVTLEQCLKLYFNVGYAFAEAYDKINYRNYTLGKEEVVLATSLSHKCDDAFTKATIANPLMQHSWYTTQIALVCTAITNLIK